MAFRIAAGLLALVVAGASTGVGAVPLPAVNGGTAASVPAEATIPTGPEITVALVDPDEKVTVWEALRLQITLVSGSLPAGIGVKSLKLSIPTPMALRGPGQKSPGSEINVVGTAFRLAPGERREFPPVELTPVNLTTLESALWSVLTYRPRKEALVATLEFENLADKRTGTTSTRLVVPVKSHPLGMYAGGIIGSLLVAIFLALPPIRSAANGASIQAPEAITWQERMARLGIRFIRGAVVTGIAILILQTTSDVPLPINLTVHDFYGGVLLGLLGDKVAAALLKWITGP